jgi:hypothetical protein
LRDASALGYLAGWRYQDVISQQDLLTVIWRQRELNFVPGSEWMYSNTNYILLGVIVSRVSGMSFSRFTEERIFRPLGMPHTQFLDQYGVLIPHRARSYQPEPDGTYRYIANSTSSVGAGGLYSTVTDMQRWYRNFDAPHIGGHAVIARMLAPGRLGNGQETHYASGLFLGTYGGARIVEHDGATPGYRAETLRFPDLHFDVAVMCNAGTSANPGTLARQIADEFLAGSLDPGPSGGAARQPEINVDPKILARYTGNYRSSPNQVVSFFLEENRLMCQVTGQPKFPLYATSERDFSLELVDAQVSFDPPDASGQSQKVSLRQDSQTEFADRTTPWPALTPKQIGGYVGEYFSPELDVLYHVSYRDGRFYVRHPRGEFELVRANTHIFVGEPGAGRFDFRCSEKGPCSELSLTNVRIRNLRFKHVEIKPVAGP